MNFTCCDSGRVVPVVEVGLLSGFGAGGPAKGVAGR
jgi:hypothetical protein